MRFANSEAGKLSTQNKLVLGMAVLFAVLSVFLPVIDYLAKDVFSSRAAEPVIEVTAHDLALAYHTNDEAAQERFGGRRLRVSGVLDGVAREYSEPFLKLGGINEFMPLQARLAPQDHALASKLTRGATVSLRCDAVTEMAEIPVLSNCSILEDSGMGARPSF
ncbi:hypothetical protein GCM10022280_12570 [Sphingomonas swuensis]|uniref:Uncharacterized protein n=1 Tax=Sphingomonas swuensis TaxID=977800 RepID=A0ABP7SR97_9SPHN